MAVEVILTTMMGTLIELRDKKHIDAVARECAHPLRLIDSSDCSS